MGISTQQPEDSPRSAGQETNGADESMSDEAAVSGPEPMTLSLMGKLFGVPALIIGAIVASAVVVVLLFGGPASPGERSVESLLKALEASSWGYSKGVLLPGAKEPWQAALELAVRLEKKEAEVSAQELASIAKRLGKLVLTDLANLARITVAGGDGVIPSKRLEFSIAALGRTEQVESLGPLIDVVRSGFEPYVCAALQQLGNLHHLSGARDAIAPILELLAGAPPVETRLMACTVLSVLADPEDQSVVSALGSELWSGDGEVSWSAALALARLGSPAGKSTLFDLLDRSFWESGERYEVRKPSGEVLRYKMPQERLENLMIAAIDAVSHLDDLELRKMISELRSDKSPAVRAKAMMAVKRYEMPGG